MFGSQQILIVEDEPLIAMDLADAVTEMEGQVIGPLATVREALAMLDRGHIAAAILDAKLLDRDITPVAMRLAQAGIPFVIYSGTGLPVELAATWPDLPTLMKPAPVESVVLRLQVEMDKCGTPHFPTR